MSRQRRTAGLRAAESARRAMEAAMDSEGRQPCWATVGRDNGDGTFTNLTWCFAPESGELLAADMLARLGAAHAEEVLTVSDVKALIKNRAEHLGIIYVHPHPDATEAAS